MRVVIIGGGISGLALAYGLQSRGTEVTLLEAGPRLGGNIQSRLRDGFLTEAGPNSFVDREPTLRTLAASLGIEDRIRTADPAAKRRYIYTRGKLRAVPMSPPAFLKSDVVPLGAKLRMMGELFTRRAPEGDESLADFGRRHVGRTATAVLVDAMQTGIFAGDVEALSVGAIFPKVVELEKKHRSLVLGMARTQAAARKALPAGEGAPKPTGMVCSFDGGLQVLVDALARKLGRGGAHGSAGGGAAAGGRLAGGSRWRSTGSGRSWPRTRWCSRCRRTWRRSCCARWTRSSRRGWRASPTRPWRWCTWASRRGRCPPPDGFGFLVPSQERRRILGTIHASTTFPWRAEGGRILLTCMVGGAKRPDLVDLDDAALVTLVREELRELAGVTAEPVFSEVIHWKRGIPQYNVGHLARVAAIDEARGPPARAAPHRQRLQGRGHHRLHPRGQHAGGLPHALRHSGGPFTRDFRPLGGTGPHVRGGRDTLRMPSSAPEHTMASPRRALLVPLAVLLFPLVLLGALALGVTAPREAGP